MGRKQVWRTPNGYYAYQVECKHGHTSQYLYTEETKKFPCRYCDIADNSLTVHRIGEG